MNIGTENTTSKRGSAAVIVGLMALLVALPAVAQPDDEDLAKEPPNPVANIINVPLEFWDYDAEGSSAEQGHAEDEETAEHEGAAEHDESGGHDHKHEFALFLGVTDEKGHDSQFSTGVEYEYRFSHRWGIGGLIDYARGDLRNRIIGVPVYFHPGGNWILLAAPGIEHHTGRNGEPSEHAKADGHSETDESDNFFVFRLGVAYNFHVGSRYGILPSFKVDFVNGEEVLVYGVSFAVGF